MHNVAKTHKIGACVQEELKNWASDLGLVSKPVHEFDRLIQAGRQLVVQDLSAQEEIKMQAIKEAEEAALGVEGLRRKADKTQRRAASADRSGSPGRRMSVSSDVSIGQAVGKNVLIQQSIPLAATAPSQHEATTSFQSGALGMSLGTFLKGVC